MVTWWVVRGRAMPPPAGGAAVARGEADGDVLRMNIESDEE